MKKSDWTDINRIESVKRIKAKNEFVFDGLKLFYNLYILFTTTKISEYETKSLPAMLFAHHYRIG